jgi:predicted dehydrogenase
VPSLAAQALGSAPTTPIDAGAGAKPTGISIDGHIRLVGDMVNAIHERRDPLIPGEEGRRSLALIRAIYESAAIGPSTSST